MPCNLALKRPPCRAPGTTPFIEQQVPLVFLFRRELKVSDGEGVVTSWPLYGDQKGGRKNEFVISLRLSPSRKITSFKKIFATIRGLAVWIIVDKDYANNRLAKVFAKHSKPLLNSIGHWNLWDSPGKRLRRKFLQYALLPMLIFALLYGLFMDAIADLNGLDAIFNDINRWNRFVDTGRFNGFFASNQRKSQSIHLSALKFVELFNN